MLLDLCPSCQDLAWLLPGALLYAEMHYRWWPLSSRYFKKELEILADAPRRGEPGRPLPLLLLVKDAHRYPITLERVIIEVETPVGGVGLVVEHDKPFDSLNIRRDRPGTVITGTQHPSYLVKEPGPGLILLIFPVHTIGNIS